MILSRTKSDSANSLARQSSSGSTTNPKNAMPDFDEFIIKRDYIGARTLLEFQGPDVGRDHLTALWTAFCDFHLGDYNKALQKYEEIYILITSDATIDSNLNASFEELKTNMAVCQFYLGMYEDSQALVETIPNSPLKIRLLFHLSHKVNEEDRVMELHQSLRDVAEDQLSLAAMHYLRSNYQDALDIYKRVLLDKKSEYVAINIYIGLCYYKLDYYDMSQEVLDLYLTKYPDSMIAINLKACNCFKLLNGRAAELEIKNLLDNGTFGSDLLRHNMVVFRNGEGALQVFPDLVDIIPEARLNLAIHYLRNGDVKRAEELTKDIEPGAPHEYILKGVIHALLGHSSGSKDELKTAQKYFHLVGGSSTECDTIPGRQSMASAFFLYEQFEEVLVYFNSIRSYFVNDDTFNYNYAQAKAATGYFKEAEDLLVQIVDPDIRAQHTYDIVLARCHIFSGHADQAWSLFLARDTGNESYALLQLIANECYRTGDFWIAAKAFDMLEKLDPNPEHWEGKRGACAGALYCIITAQSNGAPPDGIHDICSLLRDSTNPQAETMIRSMRMYANTNNMK